MERRKNALDIFVKPLNKSSREREKKRRKENMTRVETNKGLEKKETR